MPTVNNRGLLFWSSAFGCEPRRGNSKRDAGCPVSRLPICGCASARLSLVAGDNPYPGNQSSLKWEAQP